MRLEVKVFPKSSRRELILKDGILKAYITEAPDKGKANKAVIELMAEKYGVKKADIKIISGVTSRKKIVEVLKQ